jgi:hypothetical protein
LIYFSILEKKHIVRGRNVFFIGTEEEIKKMAVINRNGEG